MRHYACAILVRDGKILLGRRAAHRKAHPLCWDVIGGRVEEGETQEEALRREVREEVGLVVTSQEGLGSIADYGPGQPGEAIYHMYAVRAWTGGEPAMMDDEHTELAWFTVEEACALPDLALRHYEDVFLHATRRDANDDPDA